MGTPSYHVFQDIHVSFEHFDELQIFVAFGDNRGMWTGTKLLDTKWKNDFERGRCDVFYLNLSGLDRITDMCIGRGDNHPKDDW